MDLSARRTFLNRLTRGGLTLAGASLVGAGSAADPKAVKTLPAIQLGKNRISRMIAGGNPIVGMCPVLFDEVAENCEFVRTHGKTA
jgi:hypothetical protein